MNGSALIRLNSWRTDLTTAFRALASTPCDHPLRLSWRPAKTRTAVQNAKLNVMCQEIAQQVEWYGLRLGKDDWRNIFLASYRKGQRAVPGIDGGFVVLGASSRDLSIGECVDVIELIYAFGAEHGVKWSEHEQDSQGSAGPRMHDPNPDGVQRRPGDGGTRALPAGR